MTLSPSGNFALVRNTPMFSSWAIHWGVLFSPKYIIDPDDGRGYDLTSIIYIMMKRLKQDYWSILRMPRDELQTLFNMELNLIREERKEAEKTKNK